MSSEIFKTIKGFESYQISNQGNVKSLKSNIILKPIMKTSGYLFVNLYKNKRVKAKYIHLLVADHFLEDEKFDGAVVNHKNTIKTDNYVDNLEFVTQKENIEHSKQHGLQNRKRGRDNPLSKRVAQMDLEGNVLYVWDSLMDIERTLGFKSGAISNCCLNKSKTSKGFVWKYI